jgi:hypothetical protein
MSDGNCSSAEAVGDHTGLDQVEMDVGGNFHFEHFSSLHLRMAPCTGTIEQTPAKPGSETPGRTAASVRNLDRRAGRELFRTGMPARPGEVFRCVPILIIHRRLAPA